MFQYSDPEVSTQIPEGFGDSFVAGEDCSDLSGAWYNELGSELMLERPGQHGVFRGEYRTAVEREAGAAGTSFSQVIGQSVSSHPLVPTPKPQTPESTPEISSAISAIRIQSSQPHHPKPRLLNLLSAPFPSGRPTPEQNPGSVPECGSGRPDPRLLNPHLICSQRHSHPVSSPLTRIPDLTLDRSASSPDQSSASMAAGRWLPRSHSFT